jgi:hypothetical protein
MDLIKILSKVVETKSINSKLSLQEALSKKLITKLVNKFKTQTKDDESMILKTIEAFEKYKDGFPADKRDITKFNYLPLKFLILTKETRNLEKDTYPKYIAQNKGVAKKDAKKALKKFFELYPLLNKTQRDLSNLPYLKLMEFLQQKFSPIITAAAKKKFKEEDRNITDEQATYYIQAYVDNYDRLPESTPPILFMTFEQLEQVIDGMGGISDEISPKSQYEGIEKIYDKDNLLIFKPNGKEQCVRLAHGRSWCISREGGGNLYYNYRLDKNLTIYYVIDFDKAYSDLDFASVILVDKYNRKRIADGKNMAGGYSGHNVESWDTISKKVPKIRDKENLFVPDPLTDEEQSLFNEYRYANVKSDAVQELGSEYAAEMWLELRSPDLSHVSNGDTIYEKLPTELKKKYISLDLPLTSKMISVSPETVLKLYSARQLEKILRKSLKELKPTDISFLKSKVMEKQKEELKSRYESELTNYSQDNTYVSLDYPNDTNSKFVALYGFETFFESIPQEIEYLTLDNKSNDTLVENLPESISRFKNLQTLVINNFIDRLPENIGDLKNLGFLSINDCPNFVGFPESISKLTCLEYFSLEGTNTDNIKIPKSAEPYMKLHSDWVEVNFPEEMTRNCSPINY